MRRVFFKSIWLPGILLLSACIEAPRAQAEFVLGTICSVNLYKQGSAKVYRDIFSRLREIENLMSSNKADTDVDKINRNAGIRPVSAGEEVIEVLERALYYAELSRGAFDPTVGPLVKLWGITSETPRVPGTGEISEALSLINYRDLLIDRQSGTVFLRRPGMALDLGGIAKGYAADEAVRIIAKARIPGAIIDLGGNVFAYGKKEGPRGKAAEPWRIGLQNPLGDRGTYIGILEIENKSIVTSGVYERYAEINGRQYHHILSAEDGYPVDNGLLSVTIVADWSIDADALSTAAFALGYEKGRALIESMDNTGGVFVFADRSIRLTGGAEAVFTLKDTSYRIL
ncbi:MAG: FAD:protein FMN transferase [Treponema sp.]|nr:FAD:protein FMN transferase [Treponema sp.]